MRPTISTDWFLDRQHVRRKIGEGRARALRKVGALVYRSVQKQFRRGVPGRGTVREVGEYRGLPLLERRRRPYRGGITSWRTGRSPKGFMRSSMAFAYDATSNSVVIGPRRMQSSYSPALNEMHEKGGSQSQTMYLRFRGRPVSRQQANGRRATGDRANLVYVGTFFNPPPAARRFVRTNITRRVTNRPRRYQQNGLRAVKDKIPYRFRDQIYGP